MTHATLNDPALLIVLVSVLLIILVAFTWARKTFFDEDGNSTWT